MDDFQEEWKPVVGFEGYYEVSSQGRVRNARTMQLRKPDVNCWGYEKLNLSKDGRSRSMRVYCLVTDAFLGKCPEEMQRNHIDGNKRNNAVSNLEFVTQIRNYIHAVELGLRQPMGKYGKPLPRTVSDETVASVRSMLGRVSERQICKQLGVSKGLIHSIRCGRR
jgi:NUMOD4 motif/HNH endonuclease